MFIESNQNPKYKNWLKLKQKKHRQKSGLFLVEGEHLVEEALQYGIVREILIREGWEGDMPLQSDSRTIFIKPGLFDKLASTECPQPVMTVCEMKLSKIRFRNRLLLLDGIQDPGNLGTLVRSAAAFGFDGIILGEGCVDIYNQKVIRATQGALFKIAIEEKKLLDAVAMLLSEDVRVYGTSLEDASPLQEIPVGEKMAFILGNEGVGVNHALLASATDNIFIEIRENIESLNVSIAGSVIMYQFRQ